MGHFINVFDFKKTDDLKKDKEEIFFEAEDWGTMNPTQGNIMETLVLKLTQFLKQGPMRKGI